MCQSVIWIKSSPTATTVHWMVVLHFASVRHKWTQALVRTPHLWILFKIGCCFSFVFFFSPWRHMYGAPKGIWENFYVSDALKNFQVRSWNFQVHIININVFSCAYRGSVHLHGEAKHFLWLHRQEFVHWMNDLKFHRLRYYDDYHRIQTSRVPAWHRATTWSSSKCATNCQCEL